MLEQQPQLQPELLSAGWLWERASQLGERAGFSLELVGETPFPVPLAGSSSVAGVR